MLRFILILIILLILYLVISDAQVNPLNIYLTKDSTSNTDSIVYPGVGMGTGTVYGLEDWTYNSPKFDMYVSLGGIQPLFAADLSINFNSNLFGVTASAGNLFTQYYFDTISLSSGNLKINIVSLNSNVSPVAGKYLVRIKVSILKPGYAKILFNNVDLRYFNEQSNNQIQIPSIIHNGVIKFYLGDFATDRTTLNHGDGNVNFKDASVFFQHYGSLAGDGVFRAKYDVASLGNLNYDELPVPDGIIDFWDMVMFATGYAKEGSGLLDNNSQNKEIKIKENKNIVLCSLGGFIKEDANIKIPVKISGDLNELHGFSVGATYNLKYYDFVEISNAEFLNNGNTISIHRQQGSTIFLDVVIIKNTAFPNSGEVIAGYLLLKEKATSPPNSKVEISLTSCDAIDYNNNFIKTELINK